MNAPLLLSLPQLSLTAGLLIAAVAVLRLAALPSGRLPAQTRLLLWWLVLLRLLLPVRLPCPLSVWNWLPNPFATSPAGNANLTDNAYLAGNINLTDTPATAWQTKPLPPANAWAEEATQTSETLGLTAPFSGLATISPWLLLWTLGALLCAAYFGLAYLHCHRRFRQAVPPEGPAAAFVDGWLAAHQLRRPVRVLLSPDIDAPLTYGLLHPVILLPANADFSRRQAMHFALLHEWTHIRHFDAAAKLLAVAALCLHWFNPLVWLFFRLFSRDLELACDAAVLQRAGCELPQRQAYANALLDWEQRRLAAPLSASLYNNFAKNVMEERIVAIMNMKKVSLLGLTAAGLLLLPAMALALGSNQANINDNYLIVTNDAIAYDNLSDDELHQLFVEESRRNMAERLAPYEAFGLSWQFDDPDGDGQGLQMFYQGREVRGIWDEPTGTWFTEHIGTGFGPEAGELHTVYTDGRLSGLRWATPTEAAEWDQMRAEPSRRAVQEYLPFGLETDDNGHLFYQGQRVRYFWDGFEVVEDGEVIGRALKLEMVDPDGQIDLRTRREVLQNADGSANPMGPLLGLEVYQEANFAEMLQPAAERITYESADVLTDTETPLLESTTEQRVTYAIYNGDDEHPADDHGLTIAQILAEYKPLGLEYREVITAEGTQRNVYFQGRLMRAFVDLQPGGSVFSVQSNQTQGAEDVVRTVYNEQGQFVELRLATPEELGAQFEEKPQNSLGFFPSVDAAGQPVLLYSTDGGETKKAINRK